MRTTMFTAACWVAAGLAACGQQQQSAPAQQANAALADEWRVAQLFNPSGMSWNVGVRDERPRAAFGVPYSDYVVMILHCRADASLEVWTLDSAYEASARYDARIRIGARELGPVRATTDGRGEDNTMILRARFPADEELLNELADGGDVGMLFRREGADGRWTGVAVPGDPDALAPFVAGCAA